MRYVIALIGFWLVLSVSIAGAQCFPEASCRVTEPQKEEIVAAGGTINLRESCGTVKAISTDDGGGVTTGDPTFTSSGHAGCIVTVCNSGGTDSIVLDANTNFVAAADVTLGVGDCAMVAEYPLGTWRRAAASGDNQ